MDRLSKDAVKLAKQLQGKRERARGMLMLPTLRGTVLGQGPLSPGLPIECIWCGKLHKPGSNMWFGYGGWAACDAVCAALFLHLDFYSKPVKTS